MPALLERPYERVPIDIFAGDTLTEEFGRLNPARETPVLELENRETLVQRRGQQFGAGSRRIEALPGVMNDYVGYPTMPAPDQSRSIYDD